MAGFAAALNVGKQTAFTRLLRFFIGLCPDVWRRAPRSSSRNRESNSHNNTNKISDSYLISYIYLLDILD